MFSSRRAVSVGLAVFLLGVLISGVPGLEGVFESLGIGEGLRNIIFVTFGVVTLGGLLVAWVGAFQHWAANSRLSPAKRRFWHSLLFIPAVGVIAYFWREMRRSLAAEP